MNRRPLSLVVCLLVPFVILVGGLGIAGVQGYQSFRELIRENGRGTVPTGFEVDITETGKHTLWLHTYTVHEGRAYESDEKLPTGARLVLTEEGTGRDLPLLPDMAGSKSVGAETAVSLGSFEARAPSRVSVVGTGFPDAVILSVAPGKLKETMTAILRVGGVAAFSFLLSLTLLIVLLHRRQKMMKAEAQMHGEQSSD